MNGPDEPGEKKKTIRTVVRKRLLRVDDSTYNARCAYCCAYRCSDLLLVLPVFLPCRRSAILRIRACRTNERTGVMQHIANVSTNTA